MQRTDDRLATAPSSREAAHRGDMTRPEQVLRRAQRLGRAEDQHAMLERQVLRLGEELDRAHRETVRTLIRIAAHRDDESAAHVTRMGLYTVHLAQRMGLEAGFCTTVSFASQLHDIGKIGIPDRILEKPAALDREDWKVMKTHGELGAAMLSHHSSPYLIMATDIARAHHENWNGSGYPHRLKGEAIPLAARITRLCDTYDVLRSYRPYKREVDHGLAVRAILGGDSRSRPLYFDPAVLAAFDSGHEGFREIFATVCDPPV